MGGEIGRILTICAKRRVSTSIIIYSIFSNSMNNQTKQLPVVFGIAVAVLLALLLGIFLLNDTKQTVPASEMRPQGSTVPDVTRNTSNEVATTTPTIPATMVAWEMTPEILQRLEQRWVRYDESFVGTSTPHYSIGYSNLFNIFSITILAEPSAVYRDAARQELLTALGVGGEVLCQLNIKVTRSTELTDYKNFQEIGLSPCQGSISDENLELPFFQ